jgi:hypothetical protein
MGRNSTALLEGNVKVPLVFEHISFLICLYFAVIYRENLLSHIDMLDSPLHIPYLPSFLSFSLFQQPKLTFFHSDQIFPQDYTLILDNEKHIQSDALIVQRM